MIKHLEIEVPKDEIANPQQLLTYMENEYGDDLLRWCIIRVLADKYVIEVIRDMTDTKYEADRYDMPASLSGRSAVLSIVPTGIGCEIGGYAGDAAPASALLAACADYLITNPNAVNASNFISLPSNLVYTEGYMIDRFSRGRASLLLPSSNKIGLVVEASGATDLDLVYNIVNTVRAVHGVNIQQVEITDEPMRTSCFQNVSGSYVGDVENFDTLGRACKRLTDKGVNAIAITSNIEGFANESYADHFKGSHPNPVGGVEAVISHWVTRHFGIPAAHAPMINFKDFMMDDAVVDARSAGEFTSASGLACVLIGLRNAPQIDVRKCYGLTDTLSFTNLLAVVSPAGTLGGIPMLCAHKYKIPVIAVKDNRSILKVGYEKMPDLAVIEVANYFEAAGVILALKKGISLESVRRPLRALKGECQSSLTTLEI
jgi:hypothetical protein